MAFAFSNIAGQMAPEGEDPQQQQSQVFAKGNAGNDQPQAPQAMQPYSAQNAWQNQRMGDKRAFAAAAGKTSTPSAIGGVSQQLIANQQNLQNEADKYVTQGMATQKYGVGNNAIKNAIGGNQVAFGRVNNLVSREKIDPVSEFATPDVGAKDMPYLENDAGLRELSRRDQGAGYTPGMSSFDVRALHMTPGFDRDISAIRGRGRDLQSEADLTGERVQNQVTDYGEKSLAEAQKKVRDALAGKQSSLEAQALQKASDYNTLKNQTDIKAIRGTAKKEAKKKAIGALGGLIPGVEKFAPKGIDASKYVKMGPDLNGDAFISQKEADQFNNIMKLLGTGGKAWSASGKAVDPSKNYTIDQAALDNEVRSKMLGGYDIFKGNTKKEIDAIKKKYGDTAVKRMQDEAKLIASKKDPNFMKNQAQQAFKGSKFYNELSPYYSPEALDASKYGAKAIPGQYDWKDLLNEADAKRLNEMSGSIGEVGGYGTGKYAGGFQDPNVFDKDRYLQDLERTIRGGMEVRGGYSNANRGGGEFPAIENAYNPTPQPKPAGQIARVAKNAVAQGKEQAKKFANPVDKFDALEQAKKIGKNPAKYVADKKAIVNKAADKAGGEIAKAGKRAAPAIKNAVVALARNAAEHKQMDPRGGGIKRLLEMPAKKVEAEVKKLPAKVKNELSNLDFGDLNLGDMNIGKDFGRNFGGGGAVGKGVHEAWKRIKKYL